MDFSYPRGLFQHEVCFGVSFSGVCETTHSRPDVVSNVRSLLVPLSSLSQFLITHSAHQHLKTGSFLIMSSPFQKCFTAQCMDAAVLSCSTKTNPRLFYASRIWSVKPASLAISHHLPVACFLPCSKSKSTSIKTYAGMVHSCSKSKRYAVTSNGCCSCPPKA
jgi:hypothetical protein